MIPRTVSNFDRDVAPFVSSTADAETPSQSAINPTTARFAFRSTGGARHETAQQSRQTSQENESDPLPAVTQTRIFAPVVAVTVR